MHNAANFCYGIVHCSKRLGSILRDAVDELRTIAKTERGKGVVDSAKLALDRDVLRSCHVKIHF